MMNVNQKGAVGLIEVIRDLTKQGYECFTPIHDYSAVDLMALKNNKVLRLQVKYREKSSRDVIEVSFSSVVNKKKVAMDLDAIEGWAIYCPDIDKVVYVSKKEVDISAGGFYFRLTSKEYKVNIVNKKKMKVHTEFGRVDEWLKSRVC